MKKPLRITIIAVSILVVLLLIARLANMLQWVKAASTANHPTIDAGDWIFASNLPAPKRFDFICYYLTTPELGRQLSVHRLCGLEGDTVMIRNGNLIVNGRAVDGGLTLSHNYVLTIRDLEKVKEDVSVLENSITSFSGDSVMATLPDRELQRLGIKARRLVLSAGEQDQFIASRYKAPWNQDHFGPVVVPKGKYFVLGDNRQNALDSRYSGFVNKADYLMTVLGK